MKWIGQHIYDNISRFRDDVYLEDISTGTIVSGGNLGLDSNNKIVKATEATGDITAVTITTDSGGGSAASDTSGSADFSILGSSGVGVTNSGTTITATSVPGEIDHDSLLNFASNEHFTQANITTVGTIDTGVWNGTAITASYIAAAQTNITSLGTLTALNVDDINLNGKVVTITGDTDDTFTITTGAAGATTLATTDAGGTAGNFEIAADGNITLDSAAAINLEAVGNITSESDGTWKWWKTGNTSDYLQLDIGTHGDATFTTVDAAATAANLKFVVDGYIDAAAAGTYDATADHQGFRIWNKEDVTIASDVASKPRFILKNTTDDASSPRILLLKRRENGSGTLQPGEDGDGCGQIDFLNYDDNSPTPGGKIYSTIETFVHDATNNEESGQLKLQVAAHDGDIEDGIVLTGGSVDAEVDATIGKGAASVTTVAGTLTMGSTAAMTNAGLLSVGNQTGITGTGTVTSGVWNGTAVASGYTKHVLHYPFRGYAAGLASGNFQFGEDFADPQSPFQMNQDYGNTVIADGNLPDVSNWFRSSVTVMPRAVTATRMYGWVTCGGSSDITIALCKITPTRNDNSAVVPIVVATTVIAAIDNDKMDFFNVTGSDAGTGTGSIVTSAIAQGDILMPFIIVPNTKTAFFNLTLEVEG